MQPQSRAVVMASAARLARAAGGGGVAAAQPGGGDHRRGQRRADGGGQRVQPPDQQRLALDLGVPERGALLVVAVDPLLHRVDVDERQRVRAGQQRRRRGQPASNPGPPSPAGATFPQVERAQERPQRGRRADPAEQRGHRAVPQQVHVIDAVRPGDHPGHQARRPSAARSPRTGARPDMLREPDPPARRAGPAPSPGPGPRATPDSGHQTLRASSPGYATIALDEVPFRTRRWKLQTTPIVPVQRAPFTLTRPETPLIDRWIEA